MGSQFRLRYITGDRDTVQRKWNEMVSEAVQEHGTEGGTGTLAEFLDMPLFFFNENYKGEKFATKEDAAQFIYRYHGRWEPPMAVRSRRTYAVGGWASNT